MEPTDWITAGATVVLVAVTCWYAKTTSTISTASAESAQAAKSAAEEAARSAAAAVASVAVGFEMRPTYRFPTDEEAEYQSRTNVDHKFNIGVRLSNAGSTLYVHDVSFVMYYRMTKPGGGVRAAKGEDMKETALWEGSRSGPHRMHRGEVFNFWSPTHWVPMDYLAGIAVEVNYSLNKTDVFSYAVRWWGEEAVDFDFKDNELTATIKGITPKSSDRWSIRTPGAGEAPGVRWKKLEIEDLFPMLEEPQE